MSCPKCLGQMEAGFVPDFSYGVVLQASWTEGTPDKNFLGSIKVKGRRQIPLSADRCPRCGYVEIYARA